jgi:hypothetical protein
VPLYDTALTYNSGLLDDDPWNKLKELINPITRPAA